MEVPIIRRQVHFNIPDDTPTLLSDLENGIPKIRSGAQIPLAGMDDPQRLAGPGDEIRRTHCAVIPDRLYVTLSERFTGPTIALEAQIFHQAAFLAFTTTTGDSLIAATIRSVTDGFSFR